MRSIKYLTAIIVMVSLHNTYGQDAHFSQFYATPTYLNPSFAGNCEGLRASVAHRAQGETVYGYSASLISVDSRWGASSGWGIQIVHDRQMGGVINKTDFAAVLAHRLLLQNGSSIGFGMQIGAYQKRLDWSRLTFEDQLDENLGVTQGTQENFGRENIATANIDAAVSYISEKVFGGIKLSHINQPNEDLSGNDNQRLGMKATIHAGAVLSINRYRADSYIVSPNVIYERQGTFSYTHLGMYLGAGVFTLGGWYRLDRAVVGSVGINVDNMRFGYSYDVAIKEYNATIGNAHELSLSYVFELPKKNKIKGRYKGKCPSFQKRLF